MASVDDPRWEEDDGGAHRGARIGDRGGCERLGASDYGLARGERMVFHYHLGNEEPARALLVSEMNPPNVGMFPDERRVGSYDAPRRADRRFGALFELDDRVSGSAGGEASP